MNDKQFYNLMSGLFETMTNIYNAYCESNNVTNRDFQIALWHNDSDNTPQRIDYKSNGDMIENIPLDIE